MSFLTGLIIPQWLAENGDIVKTGKQMIFLFLLETWYHCRIFVSSIHQCVVNSRLIRSRSDNEHTYKSPRVWQPGKTYYCRPWSLDFLLTVFLWEGVTIDPHTVSAFVVSSEGLCHLVALTTSKRYYKPRLTIISTELFNRRQIVINDDLFSLPIQAINNASSWEFKYQK